MDDENIVHIFSLEHSSNGKTLRNKGRHILETMHGNIHAFIQQSDFKLFGEKTFIANFRKRSEMPGKRASSSVFTWYDCQSASSLPREPMRIL
jgi:hypothetical protein